MYYPEIDDKFLYRFFNVVNANPYLIFMIILLFVSIAFLVYYNIPKNGE